MTNELEETRHYTPWLVDSQAENTRLTTDIHYSHRWIINQAIISNLACLDQPSLLDECWYIFCHTFRLCSNSTAPLRLSIQHLWSQSTHWRYTN